MQRCLKLTIDLQIYYEIFLNKQSLSKFQGGLWKGFSAQQCLLAIKKK